MEKMDKTEEILSYLNDPKKPMDEEFAKKLQSDEYRRSFEEIRNQREAFVRKYKGGNISVDAEYRKFVSANKRRNLRLFFRRAAVACLVIGLTTLLFFLPQYEENQPRNFHQDIPTGRRVAQLILSDGKSVQLGGGSTEIKEGDQNIAQNSASDELNYRNGKVAEIHEKLVWHTLKIPSRADYFVKLSDGTKVWLNSDSKLKYPVAFTSASREVFLEGEAYFEVEKAAEWPFIVHAGEMQIEVTGTQFDVKSYPSDPFVQTTLIEGIVQVNQQLLKPSEQYTLDRKSGKYTVKGVDAKLFTGWVDGMFVFRDQRLEEVMADLAKWYDIEVTYRDPSVKEIRFSGNLERYASFDELSDIIQKLEKVDIHRKEKDIIIGLK